MPPDSVDARIVETDLARLLARVRAGEEIVITQDGAPVARLVPEAEPAPRHKRIIGLLKGQFEAPADIHDGDEEIARLLEESEIEPRP